MVPWKKTITYSGMSLASLLLLAGTAFARDLYWTEQKQILASDIDGGNVTLIFDGENSTPPMDSYAVDIQVTDDHIYWSGHDGGDIWRADRDGNNAVQLVSGTNSSIHSVDIDEDGGKIYFTDYSGRIMVADLSDGANVTVGVSDSRLGQPTGLSIDRTATGEDAQILTVTANGPYLHRSEISEQWGGWFLGHDDLEGGNGIYGLAFDDSTNTVYYTNYNENTLRSYNRSTKEHELLWAPDMVQPLAVKLSPSRTHLLIAERGRGISGFELATGGYELLVDAPDAHFGVGVTTDPGTLEMPPPPPPPPGDGDTIFLTDFEEDELDALPNAGWTNLEGPVDGTALVVQDSGNVFGGGVDNQFLRVETARDLQFTTEFTPSAVATLSFDYIGRVNAGDTSRALNLNLRTGSANSTRVHVVQLNPISGLIDTIPFGRNDTPYRFDVVVNNSAEMREYERPDNGETTTIESEFVALWRYDYSSQTLDLLGEYGPRHRGGSTNLGDGVMNFSLQLDSNAGFFRSFDMDNIRIFMGPVPGLDVREADVDPLPPPPFLGHLDLDFEDVSLGEITRENSGDFLHGNLSRFGFLSAYDTPLLVVEDTDNRFGEGSENQILRTNGSRGWSLIADNNFNEEVMTLRVDMIADVISGGRLTSRFFDANNEIVSRIEFRATLSSHGTFTGGAADNPGTWEYGVLNRFEAVMTNSAASIDYSSPTGGTKTLMSGGTDMWVNGELAYSDSLDGRAAGPGEIMSYELRTFSGNPWEGDIALIRTYEGVVLMGSDAPPAPEGFADWQAGYFPGETDPAIVGPEADPDGDGVPNLVEYLLGSDPTAASRANLPALAVEKLTVEGVENDYLTLIFTVSDEITDVEYAVEVAGDLEDWTEGGVLADSISNGDGTTTYIYRDTVPVNDGSRRFMRLNVGE